MDSHHGSLITHRGPQRHAYMHDGTAANNDPPIGAATGRPGSSADAADASSERAPAKGEAETVGRAVKRERVRESIA